ncbi:PPOX class F420-dependent oxidoreductase [Spongiactinospora gelatinilytica]|uniref:PPOX class F420-dependent oxidoreductase n=1 Tax=Spongiactinospora gelatinilytica TaxID=2666298 RepID=A0A2W2HBK0_9ACTN|nr:PPOX class F420-dependent oxidoreductase [Spongiactinospora gelatinilytica]PZG47560.1 PPOX class F420-dependent oxidoreductase [Spongiactinospora gelatinilytica]
MAELGDAEKALIDRPVCGWLTTIRPDGSLHSTVVWTYLDGDDILVSTLVGRAKERHLRRNPRVSLSVLDPDDPYHAVSVSATALLEEEGAEETLDLLAKKYLGVDVYPAREEGDRRVNVRIRPERVFYKPGR